MACGIVYRVPWAMQVFVKISRGGACGGGEFLDWNFTFDNRVLCVLIDYFLYREIREKQFLSLENHWYWGTWIIHQERKGLVRNYDGCSKDFFRWGAWTSVRCSWLTSFLVSELWWIVESFSFSSFPPDLGKLMEMGCSSHGTVWKAKQTNHQPHPCSQLNQPIIPSPCSTKLWLDPTWASLNSPEDTIIWAVRFLYIVL